jgi:putative flavoprotein involved in K+ transport
MVAFAHRLDPAATQLHPVDYRNPGRLREGSVLVVTGNPGADIALKLALTRRV